MLNIIVMDLRLNKIKSGKFPLKHVRAISALLAFFLFSGVAESEPGKTEAEWEEISCRNGIRVLSREMPGSDIIAFRGIVTINADIGTIINVINDKQRRKEWVDRLMESSTLKQDSSLESIEYTKISCPWPISDRDFVFKSTTYIDEEKGQVVMDMNSVDYPAMPPAEGVVRGETRHSVYTLMRIEDGITMVEVEFYGDPKGWIPVWVANVFQKRWPEITLTRLRRQAARKEVRDSYAYYNNLSDYYVSFFAGMSEGKVVYRNN